MSWRRRVILYDEDTYNKLFMMRDHGRDSESGDVLLWEEMAGLIIYNQHF